MAALEDWPAEAELAPVAVAYLREEIWSLLPPLHGCGALEAPELWAELALLERLLYKSKSQHRGSRHFQRLVAVRAALRRLRSLELAPSLRRLRACLPAAERPQAATLPCAALGTLTARRLLAGARLAAAARAPLLRAATDCRSLLAASYFMPLALVGISLCARVAALLRGHLAAAAAAYNALAPLLPWLPPPLGPPSPPLPALLRCEWGKAGAADAALPVGELAGESSERAMPLLAGLTTSTLVFEQRSAPEPVDGAARTSSLMLTAERPRYSVIPTAVLGAGSAGSAGSALSLLFGGTRPGRE